MDNQQILEQGIEKLRKPLSLERINFSILVPYKNILTNMSQIYIFGCKQLGKKVFDSCITAGIEVLGFIDNDISIHGGQYCGRKIYALEEINLQTLAVIIIASTTHEYIINCQLTLAGFTKVVGYSVLSIFDPIHFSPELVYKNMQADIVENTKHYLSLYGNLADQESRKTLNGIINYRLTLNPIFLKEISQENKQPEYFDTNIVKMSKEEVFVDGGGYDGDTVLNFLKATNNQYKKIYFFEPDKELFLKAKDRLSEFHDIVFLEAAIYSHSDTLSFKTSGGLDGLIDNNGDIKVKALALDECIKEKITFLKLDVEGAETAALIGAKQHIKSDFPILALSGYHNPQDIWELPELIMLLNQDYQIYLRHYSNTSYETIIYAIPYKKE